jgi:hypothetical protein
VVKPEVESRTLATTLFVVAICAEKILTNAAAMLKHEAKTKKVARNTHTMLPLSKAA